MSLSSSYLPLTVIPMELELPSPLAPCLQRLRQGIQTPFPPPAPRPIRFQAHKEPAPTEAYLLSWALHLSHPFSSDFLTLIETNDSQPWCPLGSPRDAWVPLSDFDFGVWVMDSEVRLKMFPRCF